MFWRNRGIAKVVFAVTIRAQFCPRDSSCSTYLVSWCWVVNLYVLVQERSVILLEIHELMVILWKFRNLR